MRPAKLFNSLNFSSSSSGRQTNFRGVEGDRAGGAGEVEGRGRGLEPEEGSKAAQALRLR
jgi:hypothetical protein